MNIRWRPKVAEGQVDRSLTATSAAVLDVQEDGLRLAWRLDLEFRRSQRERFDVALPAEFLLEKVEGNNVRGWEIRKTDQGQKVEITLLEAAKDHEQFTLHLWRGGTVGQAKLAEFDVPLVSVTRCGAAQRAIDDPPQPAVGVADAGPLGRNADRPARATPRSTGGKESPLGIRPFEAYSFAAVPFAVRLAAAPIGGAQSRPRCKRCCASPSTSGAWKAASPSTCKAGRSTSCKCCCPTTSSVDQVSAPGEFQYAVTQQDKRPLLTIYLATGQQGSVPVLLRGKLGREGRIKELPLPRHGGAGASTGSKATWPCRSTRRSTWRPRT